MKSKITKEEINALPIAHHSNPIILVDNPTVELEAIEQLSKHKLLGFDTETRPSFTRGIMHDVSLLQFSTPQASYLFRVNKLGFSESLSQLLLNSEILKVGLSVKDDYNGIARKTKLHPRGMVDLQRICPAFGILDASLQKIYAILFNEKISKSQQLTNWEAKILTPEQQHYAALDAYACLRIYEFLQKLPMPNLNEFGLIRPQ